MPPAHVPEEFPSPPAHVPGRWRLSPLQECGLLWLAAILGLLLAKNVLDPWLGPWVAGVPGVAGLFSAKTVAAVLFLYLPMSVLRRRGEFQEDYGLNAQNWGRSLRLYAGTCAVTLPLYATGFWFWAAAPHWQPHWAMWLAPSAVDLAPRLPAQFPLLVVDQLLVVALPEEFFYRGYLQQRLEQQWPCGRLMFGIRVGRAFWLVQALFALGHLVEPHPWRLAVFFPSLIFGWLRERSGGLLAGILFHATCNLTVLLLEASVLGLR